MSYKSGIDKQQLTFMPMCLDKYISENHICRVICAFTEQFDMVDLGFKYAKCKETGCRPFDPRMMLNLYIYGYLNRVRSSRRLQAETTRNIEVMWLMNGLAPDDKTICNFRKDNTKALKETFRAFNAMLNDLNLFGAKTVATDGTKFRANNSRKNNYNRTTVTRELSQIDKRINEYMNALDKADEEQLSETSLSEKEIKTALEKLSKRKIKFEKLLSRIECEGEISIVDPDARLMRSSGDARALDVCYNVQTVVDDKNNLIVAFEMTNQPDDKGNLQKMSEKAKEVLKADNIVNLADKGYYNGKDIVACEQNGVICLVAKPKTGGASKNEEFTNKRFVYDRKNDCYSCPCQNKMIFKRMQQHSNGKEYRIYENFAACHRCLQRSQCTKSKHRKILRLPYQDALDAVDNRTLNNRELYRKRQEIVEHPFGTIKSVWGFKQFLCRSKPKVTAETALAYLAYNLRRTFNIFRANNLVSALVA